MGLIVVILMLQPTGLLAQDFQSLKNGHCFAGCPQGTNTDNDVIIRPIYTVSYNGQNKSADWVAYTVSAGSIGIASSLSREPVADNFVSTTLNADDFTEDSELSFAQYVPLVDFAGTPFWQDVNYLTNAVPRSKSLNQGAWYGLNWAIRNAVNRLGEVYVVAGPIYYPESVTQQLATAKQHRVPDAFFKLVISNSGALSAFVLAQQTPVHVHHCELEADIKEVESLTGLDLIPEATATRFNSISAALGCF